MPAYRKTGAVKDATTTHFKLDPVRSSQIALATPSTNGASVVFKAYLGIAGERYTAEVDMVDPADTAGPPITTLTGASKMGVIPVVAGGATDLWVIRTDADASTAATVLIGITTH